MNNINIIGTMTRDAELKYLPSGLAVATFSIAVNQDYKDKNGQKVEKVSFFNVKVVGKQSEVINQYFSKGSRIGITGELEQERWTAQDGTNRDKTIIKLNQFSFIDKKSENQSQGQSTSEDYNNNHQGQQRQQSQVQYQNNQGQNVSQAQYNQQQMPSISDEDDPEIPF